MKKFDITVSLGIIILCVLLMILLWLRTSDGSGTAPSYSFLAGRNPVAFRGAKKGNEDRRYTYSFEADFNDLCSKADAELIPAGFIVKSSVQILSGHELRERYYTLKEMFPRGPVWIYIYDNRQYIDLPDPRRGASSEKDGWVMIEVVYWRGWRWPF